MHIAEAAGGGPEDGAGSFQAPKGVRWKQFNWQERTVMRFEYGQHGLVHSMELWVLLKVGDRYVVHLKSAAAGSALGVFPHAADR